MTPRSYLTIIACLALADAASVRAETPAIDYGKQIQPLLAEHCYACHGPDEKTRQADLRFDLREVATGELESGNRAIVPGDAATSEMVRRVLSDDTDEQMPPADFRKQLSDEDKQLLKQWIEQGCLLYTSPSPRDATLSRMPSSA